MKRTAHPFLIRSFVCCFFCLLLSTFCLLPAAFAQKKPNRSLINQAVPFQSDALRVPPRRTPPPRLPDTVALPYNLMWGDTQNRLASLFAGVGAKVINKKTEGNTEIWTVQGLIAPNLQASLFTFQDGQLAALEFDYGQPEWDLAKYNEVMGQFRRLLEAKCEKPGEMVTRESDQQPSADGVKQSFMGYQWKRGDTSVQLFYFSAEDPSKAMAYRSISVHYHYQDPNPPEATELPANPNADPNASPLFGGRAKMPPAEPEPAPAPTPTPVPTAGADATPAPPGTEPTPAESPAATVAAASPTPTSKGGKKKGGSKPKPTPEADALPLPER